MGRTEVGREKVGRSEVGRTEVGRTEVGRTEVGEKVEGEWLVDGLKDDSKTLSNSQLSGCLYCHCSCHHYSSSTHQSCYYYFPSLNHHICWLPPGKGAGLVPPPPYLCQSCHACLQIM